ncbi:hypothetical protein AHAS_Ahas02G0122300 [Arachis hypogaea]
MGQKINSLGFRLGTNQSHDSLWFAQPINYSENLQEDKKIRDYIKNYIKINIRIYSRVEGIRGIKIKKRIDLIQVIISMGFPKRVTDEFTKKIKCVNRKLNIAITRIANPYRHPNILAEFIAEQLRNRVSFRKAIKTAIELTEHAGTKGIQKLHVSNGSERVEFLYKPFELKLIIVPIQFELFMAY